MIVECSNCGAPLDVANRATTAKCAYCGRQNQVRSLRTLSMERPAGWKPPPVWTPPVTAGLPTTPLQYQQTRGGGAAAAGAVGVLITIAVTTAVLAGGAGKSLREAVFGAWDGKSTFVCGGNDSVTIEGVTAQLPGRTAIQATANCELRIVRCNITAAEGVRAEGNRSVVIENSRIQTSGVGIWADGNKRVELLGSTVIAGGVGIHAEGISRIIVSGGHVEGSPVAIETRALASSDTRGAELVHGPSSPLGPSPAPPTPAAIRVEGALDPGTVERVVASQHAAMLDCYGRELAGRPGNAWVEIAFEITATGRVAGTRVTRADVSSAPAASCLARVLRRLRFPPPADGHEVHVTYPLALRPGP